jgi:hypothetical protein
MSIRPAAKRKAAMAKKKLLCRTYRWSNLAEVPVNVSAETRERSRMKKLVATARNEEKKGFIVVNP